jgi:hypothetical protein
MTLVMALARLLERLAGLGRLRSSAVVALGSLSLAAAARTNQSGAELLSWLLSWLLVAFFAAYLVLLLCAVLAPPATSAVRPVRPARRRAAEWPRSERPPGPLPGRTYAGST